MSLDQESITRASIGHLVDLHHSFVRALTVGQSIVFIRALERSAMFGPAAIAEFLVRRRRMPESNLKTRAIGAGSNIGGLEPTTKLNLANVQRLGNFFAVFLMFFGNFLLFFFVFFHFWFCFLHF